MLRFEYIMSVYDKADIHSHRWWPSRTAETAVDAFERISKEYPHLELKLYAQSRHTGLQYLILSNR